jgi:4-hydroxy-tetrahydrodipicolinate synthase
MARFGPVITAMVTPFDAAGDVDLAGAAELAKWLVDQGNQALVVTGTTGEVSVLPDEEHLRVWDAVRAAVDVPLLGGSGTNDTAHAVELTGAAAEHGLDGVLVVTPYYNRPGQSGLEAHFRAVAAATDLPVILYDIPARTGRKIATETLVRLATEVDNIVAVKDAAGNPPETARLLAEAPDDFEVYSGDDSFTLPLLAIGAVGVISVCTHWAAPEMREMIEAFTAGDTARAAELNRSMIPSYDYEGGDLTPNPIPTKALLTELGLPAGECRLPLGPPPDGLGERARAVLAGLGRPAP